jgi:PAP_fibrillin
MTASQSGKADEPAIASSLASRKAALRAAVADLKLGSTILDNPGAQEEVEALIVRLEGANPTPNPADDPLRCARWRLLYTTSPIVLGNGRPGFARPESCWQVLDIEDGMGEGQLLNEEEGAVGILGFRLRWRNQSVGKVKALRGERLRLRIDKFTIGGWFSVPFPGPVVGWQDQTYLDEELRVARSQYGNVFVLERDIDDK